MPAPPRLSRRGGPARGRPDALTRGAQRAETLGHHSARVADRLLCPVTPRAPYPIGDGTLPEYFKRSLEPVEALALAAARTRRITLGASILGRAPRLLGGPGAER